MASAATNYNNTLIKIQKLANSSAKAIQDSINKSNKQQMTFNSAEAEKSRSWQEKMSKSAHQMEVKDLIKAGLNPVLSTGGSGAQSYTTSSASTQNDSGASATAAVLSNELGAMSNMESARMGADAQLKASAQQAKATRFAAQQSAAAQKYAADVSYARAKYEADMKYKMNQENIANAKWIEQNKNATTWASFLDKHLRNSGVTGKAYKVIKSALNWKNWYRSEFTMSTQKNGKEQWSCFKNDPSKGFPSKDNFVLNEHGKRYTGQALLKLGFKNTPVNRYNFVKATVYRDPYAAQNLIRVTSVKTRNKHMIRR